MITCSTVEDNILHVFCRQIEDRYEESQLHIAELEGEVDRYREEIDNLKGDLEHEVTVRQRSVCVIDSNVAFTCHCIKLRCQF